LTFAGEVFVYARGDLDRIGGAALLGVIAATAAGALYAARMDDGKSLCRAARSIPGDVSGSRRRGPDGDDRRRRGLSGPRSGVRLRAGAGLSCSTARLTSIRIARRNDTVRIGVIEKVGLLALYLADGRAGGFTVAGDGSRRSASAA
jgi:hypothetical protein